LTETPGVNAAKQQDKYLMNVQEAVRSGRYKDGQLGYDLTSFITITQEKIKERFASGLEKSRDKQISIRQDLNDQQERIRTKVHAMDDSTEAQREARMLTNLREMRKVRVKRRKR
jgi:hypothetical protein